MKDRYEEESVYNRREKWRGEERTSLCTELHYTSRRVDKDCGSILQVGRYLESLNHQVVFGEADKLQETMRGEILEMCRTIRCEWVRKIRPAISVIARMAPMFKS